MLRHGGFPQIGDTFGGVPIIRVIVFGAYWGAPSDGNYHMKRELRRWTASKMQATRSAAWLVFHRN